jgi:hypothetical protein
MGAVLHSEKKSIERDYTMWFDYKLDSHSVQFKIALKLYYLFYILRIAQITTSTM